MHAIEPGYMRVTRGIARVERGLGEANFALLRDMLTRKPDAHILEVGCGQGVALEDLHRDFPHALLTGLDIAPLPAAGGIGRNFDFLQQSIETPLPEGQKFDFVYSVATFQYVDDVQVALQNIARALNPGGRAIIAIDPLYLGPAALAMFNKPGVVEWSADLQAITVYPGDGHEIMQGFVKHTLPYYLRNTQYGEPDAAGMGGLAIVPNLMPMAERALELMVRNISFAAPEKPLMFWPPFDFLKGPAALMDPRDPRYARFGPGERLGAPFILAVPRMYLPEAVKPANEKELARYLLNPENYDRRMLKPDYVSPAEAIALRREVIANSSVSTYSTACAFLTTIGVAAVGVAAAYLMRSSPGR